jgi:hypothetical protein
MTHSMALADCHKQKRKISWNTQKTIGTLELIVFNVLITHKAATTKLSLKMHAQGVY